MDTDDVALVRRGYDAFARHDVAAIEALLAPEVRWHGADEEDPQGGCRDRGQAIDFIRAALAQGLSIEVLDVRQMGDRVLVVMQSDREDDEGRPVPHGELVSVKDGKIAAMIVYERVEEAIAAAGGTAQSDRGPFSG